MDFQLQINSYLYGTRFMVWLARTYGPEKLVEWVAGTTGGAALLRDAVHARLRHCRSRTAWARWIADERAFQQANLAAIRTVSRSRRARPHARGRWGRCRAPSTTRSGRTIYAAFNYPGVGGARRRDLRRRRARSSALVDIKGPRCSRSRRWRCDPDGRHALLHDRQQRLARSRRARPGDEEATHAACRMRASATWCSTAPTGRSGASGS